MRDKEENGNMGCILHLTNNLLAPSVIAALLLCFQEIGGAFSMPEFTLSREISSVASAGEIRGFLHPVENEYS